MAAQQEGVRRSVIGILAHVDAGKTTLSEAMLYCSGARRTLGRVDHGSAFLDDFYLERERGITIFSKQALVRLKTLQVTLLDTPGHTDFSSETERALDVLDCAILVVSAPEPVQSHTRTLWKQLRRRKIPTLVFVNKLDLPSPGRDGLPGLLQRELGDGFFDFERPDLESLALSDEGLLEEYLSTGTVAADSIRRAVAQCRVFPCWFGSARQLDGVEEFLRGLEGCAPAAPSGAAFGAQVFKITRDERGVRLTHLKVTGGRLRARDTVTGSGWTEKVTQLRQYSGSKWVPVEQALPGDVVAAAGLTQTVPGMGLGVQGAGEPPALEPVLRYRIEFEQGCDVHQAVPLLRQLEEEDPLLHLDWDERAGALTARLMGPVQMDVLRRLIWDRFGLKVGFGPGQVLYRETILDTVEGVGHFEPLRHYAEVHVVLAPGEPGSGLRIASACPEDELEGSWQRQILSCLAEKEHLGVLTGSPITDMTITLTAGRSHGEHTEGFDFRQAANRAVRQGLMQARSVLLEPWYDFRLEVPRANVGRAMTDLERMGAQTDGPEAGDDGFSVLTGSGPVGALGEYSNRLSAYTRGEGRLFCTPGGYAPCTEQARVVEELSYDPERDPDNTPDSIFCSRGAGHTVKWSQVFGQMHLPATLPAAEPEALAEEERAARYCAQAATDAELMTIFERTYGPVKDRVRALGAAQRKRPPGKPYRGSAPPAGPEYVLVDGYNIIFAWDELRRLARDSLDAARSRLIERLRNYQGLRACAVIVVFDAYKVKGNPGSVEQLGGVTVVYTRQAETADMYIEKTAHKLGQRHRVRVATSDALEQIIILGQGAVRISASAFEQEVQAAEEAIRSFLHGGAR